MQNFLRLNEGDIVEIIIAFINKNVGNETITEVDYDKLGIHIDSDILIMVHLRPLWRIYLGYI